MEEITMTFEQNVERERYLQFCRKNELMPDRPDNLKAFLKTEKGETYGTKI